MNTPSSRDFDAILRSALHAEAGAIEPAAGGLERITSRLGKPHPLPIAWIVHAWSYLALRVPESGETATRWVGLAGRRLAAAGQQLAAVIGPRALAVWRAYLRWLPGPASRHVRPSRITWVKPLAAMSLAVFVVAAGVYAAIDVSQGISPSSGGQQGSGLGPGGKNRTGNNSGQPAGSGQPAPGPSSAGPSPKATPCTSPSTKPQQVTSPFPPTTTPSTTIIPTTTPPVSPSPSPTPTPTLTPSPTPSTSTTAPSSGNTTGASTTASRSGSESIATTLTADLLASSPPKSHCQSASPSTSAKQASALGAVQLATVGLASGAVVAVTEPAGLAQFPATTAARIR